MPTYNFIDISGQRFGKLVAIKQAQNLTGRTMWLCVCDCGSHKTIRGDHLRNGKIRSCGCSTREFNSKHGRSRTPTYKCWQAMKDRCYNPNNAQYKDYGARGIFVCDEWIDSFTNFFYQMGNRPKGMTIERIDNEGPYCKENCKWASRQAQSVNRRNNLFYTIKGKKKCFKHWCEDLGIPYSTGIYRLKHGKSIEEALQVI